MSGVYGLLSLFTNHPINFFQWLYYLTNSCFVILYIIGFMKIIKYEIKLFSIVTFSYLVDSLLGLLFTPYFSWLWFYEEYSNNGEDGVSNVAATLVKRVGKDLISQSASEGYEMFVVVFMIVLSFVVRTYFILCMLSYYKMIKRRSRFTDGNKLEKFCYDILNKFLY